MINDDIINEFCDDYDEGQDAGWDNDNSGRSCDGGKSGGWRKW